VRITCPFGYVPGYPGPGNYHLGLDLGAFYGQEIRINAPSRIIFAGWNGGYGQCVQAISTLDDGEWLQLFGHMIDFRVWYGQTVEPGDVLGRADSTGHSTGNHLHWGIRRLDGNWQDPYAWRLAHSLEEDMTEEETKALIAQAIDAYAREHEALTLARKEQHEDDSLAHRGDSGSVTIHSISHETNPQSHRSPAGALTAFNAEHYTDDHQYLAEMVGAMKQIRRRSEMAVREAIEDFWVKMIRRNVVAKVPLPTPPPEGHTPEPPTPGAGTVVKA
jgi:murein DD-endopeptidase MepM/ murein hydrolase activator NlpD